MSAPASIALYCLVDGTAEEWAVSASRFLKSLKYWPAGADYDFYLVLYGFVDETKRDEAKHIFGSISYFEVLLLDARDDTDAYRKVVAIGSQKMICFVRSDCEILGDRWLAKLIAVLEVPEVGAVGPVGSYRATSPTNSAIFPSPHLCTDAWAIRRGLLCKILRAAQLEAAPDRAEFESGPRNLTVRVAAEGKKVLVVGRNGRGYDPRMWPRSETFFRGNQANLLISTARSRAFSAMIWSDKLLAAQNIWGIYLDESNMSLLS